MPIVSTTKMTAQQFLRLGEDPPGVRLELVDGEIAVSPSGTPAHSFAVVQILCQVENHNRSCELGEVYLDVSTILDRFNIRRPDVLFFLKNRTNLIGEKAMEGPPDLAIEVVSPSSIEVDREDKFAQYRDAGVNHYWIIDPAARMIDGWTLADGQYALAAHAEGAAIVSLPPFPDLEIPLARLWRKI